MAKKSVKNRNQKRVMLVLKHRELRDQLRSDANNINLDDEVRAAARLKLEKMPRDSSPVRRRNRCKHPTCSRPRAYNRLTGLCRLHMRITTLDGMVPGMRKSSW